MTDKSERIVAIMIGRGGSSLKNKNILPVLGHPLLHWTAAAARRSKYIGRYYISSDDENILETASQAGYKKIERPSELATDAAQSWDAIRHAISFIEKEGPVDIIVVQHANVGIITETIMDDCVRELFADGTVSSVVPCHQHNEYHPMRAKRLNEEGLLQPFVTSDEPVSANRQDLPICYFFDHSIWVLRASVIFSPGGQYPWDCMGARIKPYPTEGCLDVHTLEDLERTAKWLIENNIPLPNFAPQ